MRSKAARRFVTCYAWRSKPRSIRILRPFASGCRGRLTVDLRYAPGPAVFYGMRAEGMATLRAAQAAGDWTYIDNAYFGREQFFRVTRNAMQYAGPMRPDWRRWARLGIRPAPWRRDGQHVLLCLQSELFHDMIGVPRAQWVSQVLAELRRHTDRPVIVREKDDATPLAAQLADCWAVGTLQSNCALDAICAGVPAFVLGESAAAPLARADLSQIERPLYAEDREPWLATLAGQQWTLEEFRNGTAWSALRGTG